MLRASNRRRAILVINSENVGGLVAEFGSFWQCGDLGLNANFAFQWGVSIDLVYGATVYCSFNTIYEKIESFEFLNEYTVT